MSDLKKIGILINGGDAPGLNAVINKWLKNNCKETPEEILEIIESEYKNKNKIN